MSDVRCPMSAGSYPASSISLRGLGDLCGLRAVRSAVGCFNARGDEYCERIALAARADRDFDAGQAGVFHERPELVVFEAEPLVAEPLAHPLFFVPAQLQQQYAAAGTHDARRLGKRFRRIRSVMQRL